MTIERAKMFKTARAKVSCEGFSAGEFVSVEEPWISKDGKLWFTINRSERGFLKIPSCYQESELEEFCL